MILSRRTELALRQLVARPSQREVLVIYVASGVALFLAALIIIPEVAVTDSGLTEPERLAAAAAIRQLIALLGGGVLAVVGVYYTHQRHLIDRRTNELHQDSNYTDRYSAAITQLGSDSLTIRLGGVYALERIARDSAGDRETVQDVLAAFIRADSAKSRKRLDAITEQSISQTSFEMSHDTAAAITVLSRRNTERASNRPRIDLSGAVIGAISFRIGAVFGDAILRDAYLRGARMEAAFMRNADLSGSDLCASTMPTSYFDNANMSGAGLNSSTFEGSSFTGADLSFTEWQFTNLRGCFFAASNLSGANLRGSDLEDADLTDATITDASFLEANLVGTRLLGVRGLHDGQLEEASAWSLSTVWPDGYVPSTPERSSY